DDIKTRKRRRDRLRAGSKEVGKRPEANLKNPNSALPRPQRLERPQGVREKLHRFRHPRAASFAELEQTPRKGKVDRRGRIGPRALDRSGEPRCEEQLPGPVGMLLRECAQEGGRIGKSGVGGNAPPRAGRESELARFEPAQQTSDPWLARIRQTSGGDRMVDLKIACAVGKGSEQRHGASRRPILQQDRPCIIVTGFRGAPERLD